MANSDGRKSQERTRTSILVGGVGALSMLSVLALLAVVALDIVCWPADSGGPDASTFVGRACRDHGFTLYAAVALLPMASFAVGAWHASRSRSHRPLFVGASISAALYIAVIAWLGK